MSETYIPTAAEQNSTITMVEDGDALTAASVRVSLEELSDAVDALEDVVFDPEIMTRHQWRPRALVNCAVGAYADLHGGSVGATDFAFTSVAPSGGGAYLFECELDLAHGAELDQVRAYVYDGNDSNSVTATVTVWRLALATLTDYGGDFHDLPTPTLLGTGTTYTITSTGKSFGYFAVTVGGTEIVDRSLYRYTLQVHSTAGADGDRWFSTRVLTSGNQIDKAAA